MGLFNGKSKEEKNQEKVEKFKEKYHLNNINLDDLDIINGISKEIGSDLIGSIVTKGEDIPKLSLLRALTEQNWIIIKQLYKLNENIEKMNNK